MYIFISHSSNNADIAGELCNILETNGIGCFLAPRDIRSGREYASEIVNGIDRSDAMLLLLSEEANQSPHVLREIERAVSKGIPIIVYKLDEVVLTKSMEYFLMTHQWINAEHGNYEAVLKAVRGLEDTDIANKNETVSQTDTKLDRKTDTKANTRSNKNSKYIAISVVALVIVVLIFLIVNQFTKNENERDTKGQQETASDKIVDNETTDKESNKESDKETEKQSEKPTGNADTDVKLGDTISLGQYNGEAIEWKVIKISEDGKEAVLITKDIITMKAFDAAESGKYNYDGETDYWTQYSEANTDLQLQAHVRGNSDWRSSNIRAWLNGTGEVVNYEGQAPVATAMSELKNGYEYEAGFLNNFTDAELAAIKDTQIVTKGNDISEEDSITTTDKVFLLSRAELQWLEDAGVNMLALPTDVAVEKDESKWYTIYSLDNNIKPFIWRLRDPVEGTSSKCYVVGNGMRDENVYGENAGLEGFGIRPAITVNLESEVIKISE